MLRAERMHKKDNRWILTLFWEQSCSYGYVSSFHVLPIYPLKSKKVGNQTPSFLLNKQKFGLVMPSSDSDTSRLDNSSHLSFKEQEYFVRIYQIKGRNVNWKKISQCLILMEVNYPECWAGRCTLIPSLSCHSSLGPFPSEGKSSWWKELLPISASESLTSDLTASETQEKNERF